MQAALRSCVRIRVCAKPHTSPICNLIDQHRKGARGYAAAKPAGRQRKRKSARQVTSNAETHEWYGRPDAQRFRAQCHPGLEEVVAEELRQLPCDIWDIEFKAGKAGVDFRYAACTPASRMSRT